MKDIKLKDSNKEIKVMDKKKNLNHFEKKKIISTKKETNKEDNERVYATNKISDCGKKTANDSIVTTKKSLRMIKNHKKNRQKNKIKKRENEIKLLLEKKQETPNIGKSIRVLPIGKETIKLKQPTAIQSKTNLAYIHTKDPSDKVDKGYRTKMKTFSINKYKKISISKTNPRFKTGIQGVTNSLKVSFNVIKKTSMGINHLMTIGGALILLVVITLFLGVFGSLSNDQGTNTSLLPLSAEVIAYQETIETYAKQYQMEDYVELIQAVMMQESTGKGADPMQSSECEYNTKYPKQPNGITDTDYSIEVGIHYLSDCLKLANVANSYDMKNISLALQGYNYGKGYISWAIENFGGYTRANAKVYSDDMKAKLQTEVYGDPSYVQHVLQYYHLVNANIVAIAKTQVGNVGGEVYWKWYGYNSRVEWCACFISWCASQSGQLDVSIPKFSAVKDGISWYKEKNLWKDRKYKPNPGDLIFFDWEQDGTSDHVGIIEKVENETIYTIEGNSNNECRERQYSSSSNVIYGYGVLN